MKKLFSALSLLILIFFIFTGSSCQKTQLPPLSESKISPLIGNVTTDLTPAKFSDGKYYLMYELIVSNVTKSNIVIEKITLSDPLNNDNTISEMDTEDIKNHLHITQSENPNNTIKPNETAAIIINQIYDEGSVPKAIDHNISYTALEPYLIIPAQGIEKIARTQVSPEKPIVISPPLAGEKWLAVNVSDNYAHRNSFFPLNGQWFVPERWAVDYISLTNDNRVHSGDPENLKSYPGYGQDLLAVKKAKVLKVVDGLDDLEIGKTLQNMSLDNLGGNYVFLDIGDGYGAFYAHIIKDTITVKEGDTVKRGQVLGKLGNSGNSTGPHLHFHIVKGSFPLAAQGVPYIIDEFTVAGQVPSYEIIEKGIDTNNPIEFTQDFVGTHADEMPADMTLVSFPK